MVCHVLFPELGGFLFAKNLNVSVKRACSCFTKVISSSEKLILQNYVQHSNARIETTQTVEIYYDGQLKNIEDIKELLCTQFPSLKSEIKFGEDNNAQALNNENEVEMCDAPLDVESNDVHTFPDSPLGRNGTDVWGFFSRPFSPINLSPVASQTDQCAFQMESNQANYFQSVDYDPLLAENYPLADLESSPWENSDFMWAVAAQPEERILQAMVDAWNWTDPMLALSTKP